MLTLNAIECMVEVLLKQNVELVACQYQSDKYNKKVEKETLKIEKVSRQSYLEELMIPNKNIAAFVYNLSLIHISYYTVTITELKI